jgi:hypothetical protein
MGLLPCSCGFTNDVKVRPFTLSLLPGNPNLLESSPLSASDASLPCYNQRLPNASPIPYRIDPNDMSDDAVWGTATRHFFTPDNQSSLCTLHFLVPRTPSDRIFHTIVAALIRRSNSRPLIYGTINVPQVPTIFWVKSTPDPAQIQGGRILVPPSTPFSALAKFTATISPERTMLTTHWDQGF